MARVHGKDVDVAFDSVQLEDETKSVTLNFEVPPADTTSFADASQTALAGKPKIGLSIDGFLDPAAGAGDITIFGELGAVAKAWDFEPDGTTGYNGYAIVTGYSITAPVDGAVTYKLDILHNGGAAAMDGALPTRA